MLWPIKISAMKQILLLISIVSFLSCAEKPGESPSKSFEKDLIALKEYFHIPGMAVIVTKNNKTLYENYFGYADLETKTKIDSSTIFPIASVTKTFATVLLMQYVESGKLSLDDPINDYLDNSNFSDAIKIKHVLSHTSEGNPGSFFNYSPRFALLSQVLEKISGIPLDRLIKKNIISKLSLQNTVPITSQSVLDSLADQIVKPYYYFGEIENGHYDVGFSTAFGLASTVRDISKFDQAVSNGSLISNSSINEMFTPFQTSITNSPYGLGIFSQKFLDKQLVWGYGQDDCFSSFLLKAPEDNLTLVILANNNLMSDPARLINGDVTYSLFALSFLKHFVFDLPHNFDMKDWKDPEQIESNFPADEFQLFYRQEILANALAAGFMGLQDSTELERSRKLTGLAFKHFPEYKTYGNQSLMQLLSILTTEANFDEFDEPIEKLGIKLLQEYEYDPYVNVYLASYYQQKGNKEQALDYYQKIVEPQNFGDFWYTVEALGFLGDYYKSENPALAKEYYQRIVDIGWNISGNLSKAREELQKL